MVDARVEESPLVGNRWVLVGAILYLLEWVAIAVAGLDAPFGVDSSTREVTDAYASHVGMWGWSSGWFSVVLLGRILVVAGLLHAMRDSGRRHPLTTFAVGAMTVSVAIEIATYAIVSGASWYQSNGGSASVLRGLDAVSFQLNSMVFGPAGVSVLCAGIAMWQSGLFHRVLAAFAVVGGGLLTFGAVAFANPEQSGVYDAVTMGVLLVWAWMLWLGVLLWRRTPSRRSALEPVA